MYLELTDIVVLTLLILVVLAWWNLQDVRQRAFHHAERHCKKLNLQLLDSNVALKLSGFKRAPNGILTPLFICAFEFSATGDDRYEGSIHMLGKRLAKIDVPPHRMSETLH
ncbi:DUF3301 domain-containing protein [Parendozoicomonas haliclonae]|uniref:DUF3301 domain-containing protein n=1 Tax=Parendozoicomonas haliclonae TaxID=1960125 RepID=A0A1X7AQN4_9GAMM|nr:DUF3301 domain-containing protein [Parendozoicomonas haliclonae]SMA50408.1 hypothetical protein EHSB41UT_04206 [Parendozoicomonas haliclonae]